MRHQVLCLLALVALPSAWAMLALVAPSSAFAGPRPLLKIGAARTVDVRAQWGKPGKPESDMEYRKRMSGTPAPKKTAAARTAKIRKPAAAPRPQRSYSPSKSKRDSPFTASDASVYFFVPVLVLVVAGFASSAASAAKAAADTSFALLTLGSVGALLLLYVGAQDDVDAEPKRRTTEEEDAENTTSRLAAVLKKVPTPPVPKVPAVPEVVKKVAKAVPTPPVPAVLKREPKEPEEELTCAPPPPADAPPPRMMCPRATPRHLSPYRSPCAHVARGRRSSPLDPTSRPHSRPLQVFAAEAA